MRWHAPKAPTNRASITLRVSTAHVRGTARNAFGVVLALAALLAIIVVAYAFALRHVRAPCYAESTEARCQIRQ